MIKIIDRRGTGKTSKLCEYAIKNNCDILIPSASGIVHIIGLLRNIASELDYDIIDVRKSGDSATFAYRGAYDDCVINIMTPNSIAQSKPPTRKLVVDEAERVLAYMLTPYVYSYDGFTMSKE